MIPEANYPDAEAVPYNEPYSTILEPGQKVTAEWDPSISGSTFFMPLLAASKHFDSTYMVKVDGSTVYGPDNRIPPTDIDDLSTVWWPPVEWSDTLEVTIKRLSDASTTERYDIQPVGWEETK